ncbi:winged helix-turn-helix transcriptional regulator [Rhodovulum sp. DZ06]|uniref:winged helix-turn-helix transcriptional regulator n=1 Tax=Rhodovulum sp. DZ06 TaxID=3425126 RepID=UPI003D3250B6
MKWSELKHDPCPVARGLSVIGDRWTMLIIRECFRGVRRFDDFQRGLGITRHVLSDRLRKLEEEGVLRREQYQERPARWEYRLTDAGRALHQVMLSMVGWAQEWGPPRPEGPVFQVTDRDTGRPVRPVIVDAETGEPLDPRRLSIDFA